MPYVCVQKICRVQSKSIQWLKFWLVNYLLTSLDHFGDPDPTCVFFWRVTWYKPFFPKQRQMFHQKHFQKYDCIFVLKLFLKLFMKVRIMVSFFYFKKSFRAKMQSYFWKFFQWNICRCFGKGLVKLLRAF